MACGLPVVASRIAGIPELIEHERSGLLVPPNDIAALAGALERLAADPVLCARLGQAARETIVSEFDVRLSTRNRARLFLARQL
jgi:glycosyltransferase involved in cell wall biosynthesis